MQGSLVLGVRTLHLAPSPVPLDPATACTARRLFHCRLLSRFEEVKRITHPHLCEYVDLVRLAAGGHALVSEHHSESLLGESKRCSEALRQAEEQGAAVRLRAQDSVIRSYALGCLQALATLNQEGLVHGHLQPRSVRLTREGTAKLTDHALHALVGVSSSGMCPELVDPAYFAPEVISQPTGKWLSNATPQGDVWALAILLLQCVLGVYPLHEDPEALSVEETLAMVEKACKPVPIAPHASTRNPVLGNILQRHRIQLSAQSCDFFACCLEVDPAKRPTPGQLLHHPFLAAHSQSQSEWVVAPVVQSLVCEMTPWQRHAFAPEGSASAANDVLSKLTLHDLYYLWQEVLEGSVVRQVESQRLGDKAHQPMAHLKPSAIFSFPFRPIRTFAEETSVHAKRCGTDTSTFHPGRSHVLCIDLAKLRGVVARAVAGDEAAFPANNQPDDPPQISGSMVDTIWRVCQYRSLLGSWDIVKGTNATQIGEMAKLCIPPTVRGDAWAVVLGATRENEKAFKEWANSRPATRPAQDKNSTSHQIAMDVERCHQYNPLLSSSKGRHALRDVLQCWVDHNPSLCYWQGLDSLCAPLLVLHFRKPARAFACLQALTHGHMRDMFVKEKAHVLQGLIRSYSQLLMYLDPTLACHLVDIAFEPDLYAVPWLLTLFAHIMPINSIFELWDVVLTDNRCLVLFVAVALVMAMRDQVLASSFDSCVVIFSNLPAIDVKRVTANAMNLLNNTPHTITINAMPPEGVAESGQSESSAIAKWMDIVSCGPVPMISIEDIQRLQSTAIVLDIRPDAAFRKGHLPHSIQTSSTRLGKLALRLRDIQKSPHSDPNSTNRHAQPIIVVVASDTDQASRFAGEVARQGIKHVCILKDLDYVFSGAVPLETSPSNARDILSGVVGVMTLGAMGEGEGVGVGNLIPDGLSRVLRHESARAPNPPPS